MSRSTVNRVLLALVGVLLLVGGLLVMAGGFDFYRRTQLSPPGWWPLTSPSQPVLSNASRTRWRDHGWWWPAVVAALAVVFLLALWWLIAQLRRPSPAELELPTPGTPGLRLRLRGAALAEVVRVTALDLPEVEAARVRLIGRERRLRVRAELQLAPGADVVAAVAAFHTGPLAHARAALGRSAAAAAAPAEPSPADLPADLRLRVTPTPIVRDPRRSARGRGRRHPRVE